MDGTGSAVAETGEANSIVNYHWILQDLETQTESILTRQTVISSATGIAEGFYNLSLIAEDEFQRNSTESATSYVAVSGDCPQATVTKKVSFFPIAIRKGADLCPSDPNTTSGYTFYGDGDGDSYGDPSNSTIACTRPSNFVANALDNCPWNSTLTNGTIWYFDGDDGDGYGDPNSTMTACSKPANYVLDNSDECPQTSGATGAIWYADTDSDTYGDPASAVVACTQPTGYVSNGNDACPGDGGTAVGYVYYRDADGDNYGDVNDSTIACTAPTGYVSDHTDCDDSDGDQHPNQNWYPDVDGDTYGDSSASPTVSCTRPDTGYVTDNSDCDDSDADQHPGQNWYPDADGDGYGADDASPTVSCLQPSGPPNYVTNNSDCYDGDSNIYPDVPSVTTTAVTDILTTSATGGGSVTSAMCGVITERGVCWSTTADPTTSDDCTQNGTGVGAFTVNITGLEGGVTYHARAYASNGVDIGYGGDVQFTTNSIYRVKSDVSGGNNDGSTWGDAYATIGDALSACSAGDEIWVAAGIYSESLTPPSGLGLYGGFNGTESDRGARLPQTNLTVIDGSGGASDHVITLDSVSNVTIDGFTIAGGIADGGSPDDNGGGITASNIDASVVISNCYISGNTASASGGGLYLNAASPTLVNCILSGNKAGANGGAIAAFNGSTASLINCVIAENMASGGNGGGMYVDASSPILTNVIISGNRDTAAIYEGTTDADPTLDYCLFYNNLNGHYYDADIPGNYTDVATLMGAVAEVTNSVEGDPLFFMDGVSAIAGSWDAGAVYDGGSGTTTLSATGAFAGRDLVGRLVAPDTTTPIAREALIIANDDNTLTVAGDASSSWADNGDAYKIVDYHIESGSPAIDAADGSAAPAEDFEGDARFDDVTGDTGSGSPSYADIGVDEYTEN